MHIFDFHLWKSLRSALFTAQPILIQVYEGASNIDFSYTKVVNSAWQPTDHFRHRQLQGKIVFLGSNWAIGGIIGPAAVERPVSSRLRWSSNAANHDPISDHRN